jgi:cellulose synthase operon protein C
MLLHKTKWMVCWALTVFLPLSAMGQGRANKAVQTQDGGNKRALSYFANAADYQNAGAFELAAEEWEKLVKEFPSEAQTSTAWHHLGICNLQRKEPNFQRAIEAFRESLKDPKLELREETLVNLSWALFSQSRKMTAGSPEQTRQLEDARAHLTDFPKTYPDSTYLDQAIFYLGDIEHQLGNRRAAIGQFKRFLENDKLTKSSLRPDAQYALAVAYQEEGEAAEAGRRYQEFLSSYANHKLADEVRIRAAELLLKGSKLVEAEALLKQVSISDQKSLADLALLRMGFIYSKQGKTAEAAAQYEKLISQFANSSYVPSAALALGQLRIQQGNFDKAIESLRKVGKGKDPAVAEAAHWIAVALMKQQKHADAARHLSEALKLFPDATALQLDLADAFYGQPAKRAEARKAFESLAMEKPDSPQAPRATYNAAFVALEAGEPVAAQQWAEKFLSKYPNDALRADVAHVAAEALLRQGLHDASAQAFGKLIEADAKNESVNQWRLRQAMAYYLAGKYDQAISNAQRLGEALTDKNLKAEAKFILGASLLYAEQAAQAVPQLEESQSLSDNWSAADEALFVLGEAYQRLKNNLQAKQSYQKLLQKHSQSRLKAQAQYKLAQIAAAEGSFADAINQYRSLIAEPAAANYHNFAQYGIAWCLMQQDQHQAALNELQPLIAKNLQDSIGSEVLLAQGICLRKVGQAQESVAALNQFLQRSPKAVSLANGLFELGLAHTSLKQLDQANAAYERIINEVPDYAGADRVLYEIAWNLTEQDKGAAAAVKFSELARMYPQSSHAAEANYMVAQHQYENKQFQPAIQTYEVILGQTQDPELLEKTLYKLGWTHFQLEQYDKAVRHFDDQIARFGQGKLAVDGLFMKAECQFKRDQFAAALDGFTKARAALESWGKDSAASTQVRTLIYLHGAQSLRELKCWAEAEQWLNVVIQNYADSPYLPTALYELGFSKQNQGKTAEAITNYSEVASNYRNEVAARARFMLGELYFSQKDFVKAIPEFQRVMYGFGGDKAPDDIKNWQAKSAFEAARCSEVLISDLNGQARRKVVETAIEFYEFVIEKHAKHELAAQAQTRLGELQKLR